MTRSTAANLVLYVMRGESANGDEFPTTSHEHIIKAIIYADHAERIVISMAYPELVEAVTIYESGLNGVNTLIEMVIG